MMWVTAHEPRDLCELKGVGKEGNIFPERSYILMPWQENITSFR